LQVKKYRELVDYANKVGRVVGSRRPRYSAALLQHHHNMAPPWQFRL